MFGNLFSKERKARSTAAGCLEIADRVWNFRRDVLTESESGELRTLSGNLRRLLGAGADAVSLQGATESLEAALRRMGGAVYPTTLLGENVEFILVVAIVIIGFRAYFAQNFEIPTNSMWPTYNGMTPEVFPRRADEPGPLREAGRILALGAWPHRMNAPVDGEILIPVGGRDSLGYVHCRPATGLTWLVFPSKKRECTLLVGDEPVKVRLPVDFDFDWAVYSGFFGQNGAYSHRSLAAAIEARLQAGDFADVMVDGELLHCIRTGRHVRAGDRVFAFDVLAGDKVFVDRILYNFSRPTVGTGFVFSTDKIPGIAGTYGDEYLIKRLVGVPGDTLEVRGTALYSNGAPITGSPEFEANAHRLGRYPGYEARGLLDAGSTVHVGPGTFFAMGDNSPNSFDGRYWGFVPAKEAIGPPMFIYYPLARWGIAR
jgi:signal peptidase I